MRSPAPDAHALGVAVRVSLTRPYGTPLVAAIAATALTLVAVDGAAGAAPAAAVGALLEAFARAGKPARRVVVLVASAADRGRPREAAARLSAACPGVARVLVHDPEAPHGFVPGVTSHGVPVALDEALLEAEALVTMGPARRVPGGVS
ncbi:MAG: DUF2088 domain-containing protein, partial [Candidatus Eisenbacteria bacterium]|nr:DUF2088 domain-containing protein [Candidatus Eisenbacteria bacterium]